MKIARLELFRLYTNNFSMKLLSGNQLDPCNHRARLDVFNSWCEHFDGSAFKSKHILSIYLYIYILTLTFAYQPSF